MSMVATTINLDTACDFAECSAFAWPIYQQLHSGNYDLMSVAPIPETVMDWREEHRTARKRADRCERRGYSFVLVRPERRVDELYAINTSMPERQGRLMSTGYQEPPSASPDPVYPCIRHAVRRYGVEDKNGVLVAYLWLYRIGQLALISQILGHGRHLENEVMYLLWQGMVDHESSDPDGFLVYNRHDSGTDGLRFFKERVGLSETPVRWHP